MLETSRNCSIICVIKIPSDGLFELQPNRLGRIPIKKLRKTETHGDRLAPGLLVVFCRGWRESGKYQTGSDSTFQCQNRKMFPYLGQCTSRCPFSCSFQKLCKEIP
ncbi:hypothetical protein MARHY2917 [Marinobacter nauticus ATCC 49840]|nr:hypothetical protein MARHY2917 [Marinobacter nauticus ATCC 49840]